jgi:hypothetical protein
VPVSAAQPNSTWQLELEPGLWTMVRTLLRVESPFVMVNLLVFREQATGTYASRSGREAYVEWLGSREDALRSVGARLLWSGDVEPVETDQPPFELVGLAQYTSVRSFLRFALRRDPRAGLREAGLRGQWLTAAQSVDSAPWDVVDHCALVELVGLGEGGTDWLKARRAACTGLDGELIWRGHPVGHLMGSGPRIDEILVTGFPNVDARAAALEAISGIAEDTGVETWWTYKARRNELLPGLRPDDG